ncbi:ribonuclease H2 non-catalytic subunit-domain-containing protein [Cladorrhinum sp. PSN259]|nr:ribonuclease H2 non-catalytic subunit-domain-containing protein [Cladorrhinum sp. PSN259]
MSKSTTVLAIKPSSASETQKITPHLLPCAIKHSGSIGPVSSSYWNPLNSGDGKQTSYFRGRKLTGKTVSLPAGYKGVVAVAEASTAEQQKEDEMVESEVEIVDLEKEESNTLEVEGEFDEVVIWAVEGGGASEVMGDDNVYVRGVEEWVKVAGAVHGFGSDGEAKEVSSS